jgi:hypothetical protein
MWRWKVLHVKRIAKVPLHRLIERAREECKGLEYPSVIRLWEVYDEETFLGVFGINAASLAGGGSWIWFGPGPDFLFVSGRVLRRFRRIFTRLLRAHNHVTAFIQPDFLPGLRFARFFGLKETGTLNSLKVYERWQQQAH